MSAASSTISPKVLASTSVSVAVIVVVAALSAITPDLFAPLGSWAPVAYAAAVALAGALAGYLKGDPLRGSSGGGEHRAPE